MKPSHIIPLVLIFVIGTFIFVALAEEKSDLPPWKAELLKSTENTMSNIQRQKFGEKFNVVSYKRKGLELKPGGFSETDESFEEINIYKDGKLLVTITAGDDGGHGIIIFNNPENKERTLSIETSDMDGDGLHDNLSYTVTNKNGAEIKAVSDQNLDGEIDTVVNLK